MAKAFFRASAVQELLCPVEYKSKHKNAQKLVSFVKMN